MNQYSPDRKIKIDGDLAYVPLTRGHVAIIDAEDLEVIGERKWHALVQKNGVYAKRTVFQPDGESYDIRMHRLICNAPEGMDVDHINGNGIDNRKANLRVCTRSQNSFNTGRQPNNTSGYKGVTWDKSKDKWMAQITVNYKHYYLGRFDDVLEAAEAYQEASKKFHGEYRRPIDKQ